MGLGQTFLTIAAIALLGIITLTLNSSYLTTNQTMIESEFNVEAVSLAESYLERAVGKSFDEESIKGGVNKTQDLTKSKDFGTDNSEVAGDISTYNDFDDFQGTYIDTTERGVYNISINVDYVDSKDIENISNKETWHKKMTITVTSSYMPSSPIQMQYIYSYF